MLKKLKGWLLPGAVTAVVVGGITVMVGNMLPAAPEEIRLPDRLSAAAVRGQAVFEENCAACHGQNGSGRVEQELGPPLIHDYYQPGHHGDAAFYRAAAKGVRAHHWWFGDMPPQPQVSKEEIAEIVAFIREVQQENGIVYRPHHM